jgi:hypothetical protein
MPAESRGHTLGHRHEPAPAVLRTRQLAFPVRVAHADLSSFEVDIGPLQRDDLADAQPTFTAQQGDDVGAVVDRSRRFEQLLVCIEVVESRIPPLNRQ